ncbi:hypothetical protein [Mycolicibacterium madagascariense]|uniref:hypothetical protein n=1 Tax=Mycolicibacterium madagascariense TaxID=212765 RepID=UPI0013D54D3D|nr:hypothetical protein [Mycolicibacterium madagascariense]
MVDDDLVAGADSPSVFFGVEVLEAPFVESGPTPVPVPVDVRSDPSLVDDEVDELADEESDDVPVVSAADTP